jgi:predicted GNAT family acetyltransferase
MPDLTVRDNPEKRRYEALVGDQLAGHVFYQQRDGAIVLVHTEVAPEFEGQGVGSGLAAGTLEDIRSRGLQIVPTCSFIRSYLERHPEYADLVAG